MTRLIPVRDRSTPLPSSPSRPALRPAAALRPAPSLGSAPTRRSATALRPAPARHGLAPTPGDTAAPGDTAHAGNSEVAAPGDSAAPGDTAPSGDGDVATPGDVAPRGDGADAPPGSGPDPARLLWAAYRSAPGRRPRNRLVEHYRPLVHAVVRRTVERLPGHVEPADLVQAGVFGLLEAIERYDPQRCPRFESYAALRIRGAVLDELRAQDWVPRSIRLRAREAARAREDLTVALRRTATEREVAEALNLATRELGAPAATALLSVEHLQCSVGSGVDELGDRPPDPADVIEERDASRTLWHAVAQLGERDRRLVRLYYLENRTLAEIGGLLGVTESRICQLHTRLVGRLRGRLEELSAG